MPFWPCPAVSAPLKNCLKCGPGASWATTTNPWVCSMWPATTTGYWAFCSPAWPAASWANGRWACCTPLPMPRHCCARWCKTPAPTKRPSRCARRSNGLQKTGAAQGQRHRGTGFARPLVASPSGGRCAATKGGALHSRVVQIPSTDTHHTLHSRHKNLAVANLAGARHIHDGVHTAVHVLGFHDNLDLDLGQEVD